jgi:Transposase C of IS166 homeodomain
VAWQGLRAVDPFQFSVIGPQVEIVVDRTLRRQVLRDRAPLNVAIAQRDAALQENEKLLLILSQYKRPLFGRRSEKMDADQLQLLLSGNEASIVAGAANENAAADGAGNGTSRRTRQTGAAAALTPEQRKGLIYNGIGPGDSYVGERLQGVRQLAPVEI